MRTKLVHWVLVVDNDKIMRRSTVWNLISSIINAAYSAILMFFIGRIIGMDEVGVFSLASAYAYQCLSIGVFGVRNVQASDVKKEYTFSDYFFLRIVSGIAMYALLLYYTFFQGYSFDKMSIIFVFGVFKSIEAIEDLYHGEYQRYDRLDIGCILQATRYIISLLFFIVLLMISKDLTLSFLISTILTSLLCYMQNSVVIKEFVKDKLKFSYEKVKELFLICLPICLSNSVSTYIVNLPKYAIDGMSNDLMQSHYGILILPVVTINLLSAVIYRPVVNRLSRDYYANDYKAFFKEIIRQCVMILILTIIIIVGGYIIGLRLLGIIYGTNLMEYMHSFIVMLIGGGINTITAFLMIVLTVQRAQNHLLLAYLLTLVIGLPIATPLVVNMGIMGAAILYLVLSFCMTILFVGLISYAYRKRKSKESV